MAKYYRLANPQQASDAEMVWLVTERQVRFRVCNGGKWHLSGGSPFLFRPHIDSGRVVECDKPLD